MVVVHEMVKTKFKIKKKTLAQQIIAHSVFANWVLIDRKNFSQNV